MPDASYLIADMQQKLGDPSGNIFLQSNLLNWLNEAQKAFVTEVMPLRMIDATTISTGLQRIPIPSNKIMFDGVFTRNSIGMKMKALNFTDWNNQNAACPGARGKDSDCWTELDDQTTTLSASQSAATLLAGDITAFDVTIPVVSTTGFLNAGLIFITSQFSGHPPEQITYTSKDQTHFFGCTRGVNGTTPEAHLTSHGNAVSQTGTIYSYFNTPVILVHPSYGVASQATILSAPAASTDATLAVSSTSGFKAWGRLLLSSGGGGSSSEEVEYSSIDATNFYGVTRGLGNTNPVSWGAAALVQQCDLWMIYRRTATIMATAGETPEIKSCWHEHLQLYAMYLAYLQVGEKDKALAMFRAWKDAVEGARFSAAREYLGTMHLHDTETEGFNHLDGPR